MLSSFAISIPATLEPLLSISGAYTAKPKCPGTTTHVAPLSLEYVGNPFDSVHSLASFFIPHTRSWLTVHSVDSWEKALVSVPGTTPPLASKEQSRARLAQLDSMLRSWKKKSSSFGGSMPRILGTQLFSQYANAKWWSLDALAEMYVGMSHVKRDPDEVPSFSRAKRMRSAGDSAESYREFASTMPPAPMSAFTGLLAWFRVIAFGGMSDASHPTSVFTVELPLSLHTNAYTNG
mmetsp:Transcript_21202/g.59684  ORF Transcript_21202/g.59684 Transcript_21202/m.59684 type:complete len:235 (+) Transcript_21202:69-773(+)